MSDTVHPQGKSKLPRRSVLLWKSLYDPMGAGATTEKSPKGSELRKQDVRTP